MRHSDLPSGEETSRSPCVETDIELRHPSAQGHRCVVRQVGHLLGQGKGFPE